MKINMVSFNKEHVFGCGFHLPGNSGWDAHGTHVFLHLETERQKNLLSMRQYFIFLYQISDFRCYDSFTAKLTKRQTPEIPGKLFCFEEKAKRV